MYGVLETYVKENMHRYMGAHIIGINILVCSVFRSTNLDTAMVKAHTLKTGFARVDASRLYLLFVYVGVYLYICFCIFAEAASNR